MPGRFRSLSLRAAVAGAGAVAVATGLLIGSSGHPVARQDATQKAHSASPRYSLASAPLNNRYWMVASDGGIFAFPSGAPFWGSEGARHLNAPIVAMAPTPTGKGYWLVASDGGIFTEGDAGYFGSEGYHHLNSPIVGIAPTPSGKGYWMVASDGGIFTHGDAGFFGSEGYHHLNQPVVAMAATPTGNGYWMVASDGGIFTHGDAGFFGSEGYHHLNQPVVGMAATPTGRGYWMVATDGGMFTHGDASFSGSMGGTHLNQPVVSMAPIPELFASSIALTPAGSTVAADGASEMPVTATVTDATGYPVAGRNVDFSVITAGCGALSPSSAVTDSNGNAGATYTASTLVGSCTLQAADSVDGLSNAAAITQSIGAPAHAAASPSTPSSHTADAGHAGIPVSFTVSDSQGRTISGATVDFTTSLPNGALSTPSGVTNGSGVVSATLTDTKAGDSGTVTGTVHNTAVQASTGTLNFTPGAFAALSQQPAVGSQTAGTPYPVAIKAADAWGNSVNPSTASGWSFSGTALATAPDTTSTGTAAFVPGGFAGGTATVSVTSYRAGSVVLNITAPGAIGTATPSYTVAPAAISAVTTSAPAPQSVDADTAFNHGIPVSFTVVDAYGNHEGSGITVNFTKTLANATLSPAASAITDPTGAVTTTAKDKVVEAGTITGTVQSLPAATKATGTITIIPGAFAKMTLGSLSPSTPTAGQQYTVPLSAFDAEDNVVNPSSTSGIGFNGTAMDVAPDNAANHTGTASVGSFSNGVATVTATSYRAASGITLTASYLNGLTSFSSNQLSYTVSPAAYTKILPRYTGASTWVAVDQGATPALVVVQPPTGTAVPSSIDVTLAPADAYLNTATANTDAFTVKLNPDTTTTPDGGTLSGGAPPTADYVSNQPVTITAAGQFGGASSKFTYTPPASLPVSGAGDIVITDSQHMPAVTQNMHVVVTKVAHLLVQSTLNCTTCVAGTAASATYLAQDANGAAVANAWMDISLQGLPHAGVSPSSPTKTDASGLLTVAVLDNRAPESGTFTTGVHDVPAGDVNIALTSATITSIVGPPSELWISTSNAADAYNAGAPASEVAGVPYTVYVWSLDAHQNPVDPTGTVTVGGTALDAVSVSSQSTLTQGSFSGGIAMLQVTSAKVAASAALTPAAQCGSSVPCTAHGVSFPINPGAPALVSNIPSPAGGSYTADQGNAGIPVNFTLQDGPGNPVPNVPLTITKSSGLTGGLSAASATTNASGVATVSLTDHTAGDTGTVTGTVTSDSTVHGATAAITITPGAIHTLTLGPTSTQVVGTGYSVTVTALDLYSNQVNPAWADLTLDGSALTVSPSPAAHAASTTKPAFANGVSSVSITSYLAQVQGPVGSVHQLSIVCTAAAVTSGVCDNTAPGSTADYAISAGAPTQIVVRDSNSQIPTSQHMTSPGQAVTLTVKREDAYNNAVAVQTGNVQITLAPDAAADNGFLSGGGNFTAPDTGGAVHLVLSLQNSTSFTYTAPGSLPGSGGSGRLTFVDQTSSAPSNPTSIAITD
jgi:hypothetical protein